VSVLSVRKRLPVLKGFTCNSKTATDALPASGQRVSPSAQEESCLVYISLFAVHSAVNFKSRI